MKRFLLMPLKPSPLMLVGAFSVFFWFLRFAGYYGAAVAVIPISWFFKYCFVLLDAAVAGDDEPPVLDVEMVNPVAEQRPLAELAVIAAGGLAVLLAMKIAGKPGLIGASVLLLAALPASVAVLGLTRHPLRAASPIALARFARDLGVPYVWLVLATLALGLSLYGLRHASLALIALIGQLGFLFLFALIGGMAHESRQRLGIDTRSREERRTERAELEHAQERKRMLDRCFNELRLGHRAEAWAALERWISQHARGPSTHTEFGALLDSTLAWEPSAIGDRLAGEYLARLLAQRDNGRALAVLERRLESNPGYRPADPNHARRLRELAALAGKRALCRRLDA